MAFAVLTDPATGDVLALWEGAGTPPAGFALADVDTATRAAIAARAVRWAGGAWQPRPTGRWITAAEFFDRFTLDEDAAMDTLGDTNRRVRAALRRLAARGWINLDAPSTVLAFTFLRNQLVPAVWATNAIADARIAEIRA
jgi:hypothetical protein